MRSATDGVVRVCFPPEAVIEIKALACELPAVLGLPLSRLSVGDVRREAIRRGVVASIGETTVWRWLSEDAIRPWRHRTWIFPRDPGFKAKAERILDLYEGRWNGEPLRPDDCILSTDEKTSIQARRRPNATLPPGPGGRPARVSNDYVRGGALQYLAAWDVRRAKVFGRCEPKTGIQPFERLVADVMAREPYRSARRVFWIMDNGSSHRGARCVERLRKKWPNIVPVHTPVHASWLNQVEIYFSVVQRKALAPSDLDDLTAVERRLLEFQSYYEEVAEPFEWCFTRRDLARLLRKLKLREALAEQAA